MKSLLLATCIAVVSGFSPTPTPAPKPTCNAVDAVSNLMNEWGAGRPTTHLSTEDVQIDAGGIGYTWQYTTAYKHYSGHDGWDDWLSFLAGIEFPDFTVKQMVPMTENLVAVHVSYTPTVTATGKTGALQIDSHTWKVDLETCKISGINFLWGDAAELDYIQSPCAAASAVAHLMGVWGAGKPTTYAATEDVQVHAGDDYTWQYTTSYKHYSGHDGWDAWLSFLTGTEFPDFTVNSIAPMGTDMATVQVSYTPTVISTGKTGDLQHDSHMWTVDMETCKISDIKFHWGNHAELDYLQAPCTAMSMIGYIFGVWGAGYNTTYLTTEDIEADAGGGYNWQYATGYQTYMGHAGWTDWGSFLNKIEFPDFEVTSMAPIESELFPPPPIVAAQVSYTPTVISTGKTGALQSDSQTWTVDMDTCRVAKVVFEWGDPAELDRLWMN